MKCLTAGSFSGPTQGEGGRVGERRRLENGQPPMYLPQGTWECQVTQNSHALLERRDGYRPKPKSGLDVDLFGLSLNKPQTHVVRGLVIQAPNMPMPLPDGIKHHPWFVHVSQKWCKFNPNVLLSLLGDTIASRIMHDAIQKWHECAGTMCLCHFQVASSMSGVAPNATQKWSKPAHFRNVFSFGGLVQDLVQWLPDLQTSNQTGLYWAVPIPTGK